MSKSAAFGIAIPCEIRSKVTHLGGRGLVAIQATHTAHINTRKYL